MEANERNFLDSTFIICNLFNSFLFTFRNLICAMFWNFLNLMSKISIYFKCYNKKNSDSEWSRSVFTYSTVYKQKRARPDKIWWPPENNSFLNCVRTNIIITFVHSKSSIFHCWLPPISFLDNPRSGYFPKPPSKILKAR